jgi:hypothetical protein
VASVERCERGIEQAVGLPTAREATAVYYRECSQIQSEAPCQRAFLAAAKAEPDQQMIVAFRGCAAAYCPLFADKNLEGCRPEFQATNDSLWRAWPALHGAILTRDAGVYAPRIEQSMLKFLIALKTKPSAPAAAADASPARADAVAADAAAATADAADEAADADAAKKR